MSKANESISEQLHRLIQESDVSRYRISIETGVSQAALSKFMSGERSLNLPSVDALCRYFGVTLQPIKRKSK
ncbi:MAG: helix-turn-helix domain-containing protein [Planctomycetaceae bacterium]